MDADLASLVHFLWHVGFEFLSKLLIELNYVELKPFIQLDTRIVFPMLFLRFYLLIQVRVYKFNLWMINLYKIFVYLGFLVAQNMLITWIRRDWCSSPIEWYHLHIQSWFLTQCFHIQKKAMDDRFRSPSFYILLVSVPTFLSKPELSQQQMML